MTSLFPDFQPTALPEPDKWTKEDTAKLKADPDFLKDYQLLEWPDHAAMVAAAFGWKTYQQKVTIWGQGVVSKRVKGHSVRIERSVMRGEFCWEMQTTRGDYGVGLHVYQPFGPVCRFGKPPIDACSDEEFKAIHQMFDSALERLALANLIPREMSSHDRMELIDKHGKSYNEALKAFGFELNL